MTGDECPVCLEALTGTVVTLGCCKNQLHVQCYVSPCPLCRAPLPEVRAEHVVVPVPVPVPDRRVKNGTHPFLAIVSTAVILFLLANTKASC